MIIVFKPKTSEEDVKKIQAKVEEVDALYAQLKEKEKEYK